MTTYQGIPSQFSTTTIFDYGKRVLLKCYKVCKIAQTEKLLCSQQMLQTDSVDDSIILTTMTVSPSNVDSESNKKDEEKYGEAKPMVWIGQISMIYGFGALSYLTKVFGPRIQGFYCGDESIRLPYKDSTIPIYLLYLICYVLLISTILFIEYLCSKFRYPRYQSLTPRKYKVNNLIILPGIVVRFIKFFLISQLGFVIQLFFLNVTKYSTGKLRPHFLAVCEPHIDCNDPLKYIQHYVCIGKDESLIKDARLSFFSGHTSQAFYYATFLVLYLHARFGRTLRTSVLFPLIYAILMISASYVGYSRINDNKHHPIDVAFGAFVGIVVAVLMLILFWHQFYDISFPKLLKDDSSMVVSEIGIQNNVDENVDSESLTLSTSPTIKTEISQLTTNSSISTTPGASDVIITVENDEAAEVQKNSKITVQNTKPTQPVVVRPRILNSGSNV